MCLMAQVTAMLFVAMCGVSLHVTDYALLVPATALGDGTEVTWVSEKDLRTIGWHLLCPCLAVQECRIVGSGCLK